MINQNLNSKFIKGILSTLIVSSLLLFSGCNNVFVSWSDSNISTGNENYAPIINTKFANFSLYENNGTTSYSININNIYGNKLDLSIESNDTTILTVQTNFTNPLVQADYKDRALDFNLTTVPNAFGVVKITITINYSDKNITTFFVINVIDIPNEFQSGDKWKGLEYNTTISPHTRRTWLDRNLGASSVCTKLDDKDCYGSYYQWGRNTDGHEKPDSNTTDTQAVNILHVDHRKFIISSSTYNNDWARNADRNGSKRSANWSKTDGSSICPIGYRVPTIDELTAETIGLSGEDNVTTNVKAFKSFLKLPSADHRKDIGDISKRGDWGYIWSSSHSVSESMILYFYKDIAGSGSFPSRATGFSVRCVKDTFQSGDTWKGLKYKTITSSHPYTNNINVTINGITKTYPRDTKRVWLDRNLGASRVCIDYNDTACFGDYYQWGRNADGHEEFDSNTTNIQASSTKVVHGDFIIDQTDWLASGVDDNGSIRSANWLNIDGSSICPVGYRVPTEAELTAETTGINNRADAFNSFLKLPSAGYRYEDYNITDIQSQGGLWSSSYDINNAPRALHFTQNYKLRYSIPRIYGFSIRCIKD